MTILTIIVLTLKLIRHEYHVVTIVTVLLLMNSAMLLKYVVENEKHPKD